MIRGYLTALLVLLGACATTATRTYEESDSAIKAVLGRKDGGEAALTGSRVLFVVPRDRLAPEKTALLAALRETNVQRQVGVHGANYNWNAVIAWSVSDVFELEFPDGMLHVEWRPEEGAMVSFARDDHTSYVRLEASPAVDRTWAALAEAARVASNPGSRHLPAPSPLASLRQIGVDYR